MRIKPSENTFELIGVCTGEFFSYSKSQAKTAVMINWFCCNIVARGEEDKSVHFKLEECWVEVIAKIIIIVF